MDFSLYFCETEKNSSCKNNIKNGKWKYGRTKIYDTFLVIIENREKGVERNSIYLSSEKCCKITKKRREKESPSDGIKITKTFTWGIFCFPEENKKESKYTSKKGKVIVFWYKEEFREGEKISSSELHQYELFVSPFSEKIPNSRKEKHRESEINDCFVRENRSGESFFPGKMMKKSHKQKPCYRQENTEDVDFEAEKFDRGIHVRKLKIKN